MSLSCRAKAFSVENLLRDSGERTNVDVEAKATLSTKPPLNVMSSHPKHREHLTRQKYITNKDAGSRNELFVKEDIMETSNISAISSRQFNNYAADYQSYSKLDEKNNQSNYKFDEKNILNREDKERSADCNQKLNYVTNDITRGYRQNAEFIRIPFAAKNDEKTNSSETDRQFVTVPTSGLTSPSCFRHGEVSFCHHPGVISVIDSLGSNNVIVVKLCHADLWADFHVRGTEMIITKSGRRMFPALKVSIGGLNPTKTYSIRLDFLQPDSRKYRYIYHSSRWMVSGSGDKISAPQSHQASDCPLNGQVICSQAMSFERLKLTNTEPSKPGQVSLVSMQKFQPQVVVEEVHETDNSGTSYTERYDIIFPQTSFMAVTAYQNHQITTLKIASNPFAKGFRESGKNRIPYHTFMPPLTCKTALNYLHHVTWPPVLPAFHQRDDLNVGIARRHNYGGFCCEDSCNSTNMMAREDDYRRNFNRMLSPNPSFIQRSTLNSAATSDYVSIPYIRQNQDDRNLQHLLHIQHDPNSIGYPVHKGLNPITEVYRVGQLRGLAPC